MSELYNPLKLSEHRSLFHKLRALVLGSGAVGSYLMEMLAKLGVSPDAVDFDTFTLENAAKQSCLVRTPEDVGRNKAECTSQRVQPLLDDGCTSNGIDADLCKLGPEAFADYDIVFAALDNFAAKILLNELIRRLPQERRPILIMDGTHKEMAQSVILDNREFCLRCLIDESWLKDSGVRTSCVGPQIRMVNGVPEIVSTSNMASSMAAHLSAGQFHAHVLGCEDVMNRRITYTAYPNLELSVSHPKAKRNCPGCAIKPPSHIEWLSGTVLTKTLGEALAEIGQKLGTDDFELSAHLLNYKNIVYSAFITEDVCRCCGKPIRVMKHEGRTFPQDLICESCAASGAPRNPAVVPSNDFLLHAFSTDCREDLKSMTLYELGYPLGAHIEVFQRRGALDFLDEGKIRKTVFSCAEDSRQMHSVHQL